MKRRAIITIKGLVQRGGFRMYIEECAFPLGITGWVRNMPDRSVKIMAEGEKENIEKFIQRIRLIRPPIHIASIRSRYGPATDQFPAFDVIRDEDPSKVADERADTAIVLLSEALSAIKDVSHNVKGVGSQVQRADSHLQGMDFHIQSMDSHLQGMDSHMGTRFDRLDRKYGEFGKTMKGMAGDTRRSGKAARATTTHIKIMARDMKCVKGSMTGMAKDIKAIRNAATAPRKRKSPIPA